MTTWWGATAALFAGAGVVLAALALVRTRSLSASLPILLDLLLVAGLLRLGAADSWRTIIAAATVVALRRLLTRSLRHAAAARAGSAAAMIRGHRA
ncbi:hypothetical protein [Nocardia sputi]|uniref:hypothetical protein n=1 Tax=Nocardia sputi TaxID=2943705 RepID=UPI0020BEF878|nr:hypothetical protein [Nocardia sputi]